VSAEQISLDINYQFNLFFSKYEEIYPPDVGEFVYITDDTYSKKQVLRMEHLVLKVLGFDLSVPTTLLFTNLFARMSGAEQEAQFLAQVFIFNIVLGAVYTCDFAHESPYDSRYDFLPKASPDLIFYRFLQKCLARPLL
jgi:hypothetical protein